MKTSQNPASDAGAAPLDPPAGGLLPIVTAIVTAIGSASVAHQIAISRNRPATIMALGSSPRGAGRKATISASTGPANRPNFAAKPVSLSAIPSRGGEVSPVSAMDFFPACRLLACL